jgi:hypothetical protein
MLDSESGKEVMRMHDKQVKAVGPLAFEAGVITS